VPAIVLHQWEISPFCGKVRKVLWRKDLPYRVVDYAGLLAARAAGLSGSGKLPVLDYDGTRIQDSTDIVAFLEKRHPEPSIFPADPAQRAQALLLEDWADESLYWYEVFLRAEYPAVFPNVVSLLCKGRPGFERGIVAMVLRRAFCRQLRGQGIGRQKREVIESHLFELLGHLDTMLAGRQWLVGASMSIADIAASAQIDEMLRTSVLAPRIREHRNLMGWIRRCAR
jgi:glutathione S-transferase